MIPEQCHHSSKPTSSKTLMGQVSREISPSPPSGRPGYNLDDYIRETNPYEVGDEALRVKRKESDSIVI